MSAPNFAKNNAEDYYCVGINRMVLRENVLTDDILRVADKGKHFKKALFNQYKNKAEASDKSKVKLMIWLSKFFHSVRYQNCEEEEADSKTIDILESLMEMMFNALAPNYDEECRWWWEIEL